MSTSSFSPSFHPNSPYTPKTINKTLSPSKRKRKVFHNNNANSGLKLRKAINRRRSQDKTQSILSLNKEIGDHFSRLSDSAWLTIRMGSELCDYKKNETIWKVFDEEAILYIVLKGKIALYRPIKGLTKNYAPKRQITVIDGMYMELFGFKEEGSVEGDLKIFMGKNSMFQGVAFNDCSVLKVRLGNEAKNKFKDFLAKKVNIVGNV